MRKILLSSLILLAWAAGLGWWFREPLMQWTRSVTTSVKFGGQQAVRPDPHTYATLVSELERWRRDLAARYRAARTDAERQSVENDARVLLEATMPEMMRCWLGTPWDFNGTAARPGDGAIACGYYVATVVRDAGFDVDRFKLAQQPSSNILRSFLSSDACLLTVGKPYEEFVSDIRSAESGIYLVGLDTHVAFLVVSSGSFRFVHSSGSRPWRVVDESCSEARVLQQSNWRMIGNLTADRQVLRRWLKSEKILVRRG